MIIVDASVVNKLFLPNEIGYQQVERIFEQHVRKLNEIIVPDLLFYEVANTLATKSALPISQTTKSLADLADYGLNVHHSAVQEISRAAKFSKKYHVSVYDAIYAVLAILNKCDLITADNKFVKQVNLPFVKTLGSLS